MDPGPPIELAVYASRTDTLLFVPALCLPPREAQATFGPLERVGSVTVTELDGAWAGIVAQIERHLFATVPSAQGPLLAGLVRGVCTPQPAT
jgi:hypothetical protein